MALVQENEEVEIETASDGVLRTDNGHLKLFPSAHKPGSTHQTYLQQGAEALTTES